MNRAIVLSAIWYSTVRYGSIFRKLGQFRVIGYRYKVQLCIRGKGQVM